MSILALDHQPVGSLHHRRALVGFEASGSAINPDERVGLLRARAKHASRAMILERPAHEMDAVREQRGRDRVAGVRGDAAAVEGEVDQARSIDAGSGGHAPRTAHDCAPAG